MKVSINIMKTDLLKLAKQLPKGSENIEYLLENSINNKNTGYFKKMIEGNTGIYYASPVHLHSDYNKTRVFDKSELTLKIMEVFNKLIN